MKEIEYYINGKFFVKAPYDKWDKLEDTIRNIFYRDCNYYCVYSDNLRNSLKDNSVAFINPLIYKTIILQYKIFTGFTDKNGNRIYDGDKVETPYGFVSEVSQHYDSEAWYVREQIRPFDCIDRDIENFKDYKKFDDVIGTQEKYWKRPHKITHKELLSLGITIELNKTI